jgi:hypothetical protein
MLLVNMWITFPAGEGKFMSYYTVTITKPDGTTQTINIQSYVADGTSWFDYVVSAVGTYRFQFSFGGEYFAAGYYSNGNYSATTVPGWIYVPAEYIDPATSPVTNLTVQQALVPSWSSLDTMTKVPGPGEYWSRPIEPNNREWNVIAGNYPTPNNIGGGTTGTEPNESWHSENYGAYVEGPGSAHIVWYAVSQMAGIMGGDTGTQAQTGAPSSSGTANTPSVIYMGRCYTTVTKSLYGNKPATYAECYNVQTGQIYYDIATANGGVTPTYIAYWPGVDLSVPGAAADASWTVDLLAISGTFLYKINPDTGAVTTNVTLPSYITTSTATTTAIANFFYNNGYFLSFQGTQNYYITTENITLESAYAGFVINWTEQGSSTTFASRIVSNVSVTIPVSDRTPYEVGAYGSLGAYDPTTGITIIQSRFEYGDLYGTNLQALSLVTGKSLWNYTTPVGLMEDTYRPTNAWCVDGVYVAEMERGYFTAWKEQTGVVAWNTTFMTQSPENQYPWGEFYMYDEAYYTQPGWDGGIIYAVMYTGVLAINDTNGAILWNYADPAPPFETPYTTTVNGTTVNEYSVGSIEIVGGRVYFTDNEHTPTLPPERGWGLVCIDAVTGTLQWKILGSELQTGGGASDGYLLSGSTYDGIMYVFGMGPSATTVSAPQTAVTSGDKVVISGTVLDESPASAGTPCIADQYQDTWMDYLHFQMPINGLYGNITVQGVPVVISAVDPNGNSIPIATVTSDVSGTFSYTWTAPTLTGDYKIMATFAGSNSYGASWAETHATVVAAPPVSPTPTPISISGLATTSSVLTYIIIAVIVMIIAIAILGVLMLRKHP